MFVQGPLVLRQGGVGFVGRYPYFSRNGTHIGFTAAIVRKETLVRAIGLDSLGNQPPYRFELLSISGNGLERSANDSLTIPFGDWVLYGQDTRPGTMSTSWWVLILGGLLAVGLGVLSAVLAASPVVLRRRVAQQTHALSLANAEMRQIAHVTSHDLQEPMRVVHEAADLTGNPRSAFRLKSTGNTSRSL